MAGWSIPSGLMLQQLRGGTSGQYIWSVHRGATEGPPGELGKAGLGLTARYKAAMFWRAAYHVRDYWHVKPAQN